MALHPYGFTWGPLDVTRVASTERFYALEVTTSTHRLEVAASPKGKSLRVWLDGVPLVPLGTAKEGK